MEKQRNTLVRAWLRVLVMPFLFFSTLLIAQDAAELREALDAVAVEEGVSEWSPAARSELDALLSQAVARAEREGITDARIEEAATNFRLLLRNLDSVKFDRFGDPLSTQIEQVREGRYSLCPLWPFC
jgi:hypothetical protein